MSCLGQCGDCQCEQVDVCKDSETKRDLLEKKLKVLKDYGCLLANTSCVGLPKRLAQYTYYMWCYLRDMNNMLTNLDKRVDNLCSVVKCHEAKINALVKHLLDSIKDKVSLNMQSVGSNGQEGVPDTYTKVNTDSNGNFTIQWNMVEQGQGEVGVGRVYGRVNHSYTPNNDGSIHAKISSVTIDRIVYTNSGKTTYNHNGRFTIYDANGSVIYQKGYDPATSWSQDINQTITYSKEFDLQPSGGQSESFKMLSTLDEWENNPTRSSINAQYINNNDPIGFNTDPCPIACDACEEAKEEGDK